MTDQPQTFFLEGPAGTGKTTEAIKHLREMLEIGIRPEKILVLVPQRTLSRPYQLALAQPDSPDAAGVDMVTIGGLARRGIDLYWNLIARDAGFTNPLQSEPIFLNVETAQYYMSQFVDPAVELGLFDSISVPRARLITQALDNLNKAALNNFSLNEVVQRLSSAWNGQSARLNVYRSWLEIAEKFRQHCYENNLLDFSLTIKVFTDTLLQNPAYVAYLRDKYRHLIADNVEEMTPIAQDFIKWLLEDIDSAWLLNDTDGGFRLFLGADPVGARFLRDGTDQYIEWDRSLIQNADLDALSEAVDMAFDPEALPDDDDMPPPELHSGGNPTVAFYGEFRSFYPQMLDWACDEVIRLVKEEDVAPSDIVMLAPYLSDSMRFTIMNRLENAEVPVVSHRPSRAIRDEPSARAMLTLMQLANPRDTMPPADDVLDMLVALIGNLDPIRASLLTQIVYGVGRDEMGSFDAINPKMQQRITFTIGERYEILRNAFMAERERVKETPPDYFLRRMFGDVGSQPGFGFHADLEAGTVIAQMVDSAFNFRQVLYPQGAQDWSPVWIQFRDLVTAGLLAASHDLSWHKEEANAVFIAPAYTFLMRNRPVRFQFWLDVGSNAWWDRLDQPLTHPYVVHRNYAENRVWSDDDEYTTRWEMLRKVVIGLTRRCSDRVYLAIADLGEQGFEQRGPMLRVFQQILQLYGDNRSD
jgi:hypothetical protein